MWRSLLFSQSSGIFVISPNHLHYFRSTILCCIQLLLSLYTSLLAPMLHLQPWTRLVPLCARLYMDLQCLQFVSHSGPPFSIEKWLMHRHFPQDCHCRCCEWASCCKIHLCPLLPWERQITWEFIEISWGLGSDMWTTLDHIFGYFWCSSCLWWLVRTHRRLILPNPQYSACRGWQRSSSFNWLLGRAPCLLAGLHLGSLVFSGSISTRAFGLATGEIHRCSSSTFWTYLLDYLSYVQASPNSSRILCCHGWHINTYLWKPVHHGPLFLDQVDQPQHHEPCSWRGLLLCR